MTRSTIHRIKPVAIAEVPAAASENSYHAGQRDAWENTLFQVEAVSETLEELIDDCFKTPDGHRCLMLAMTISRLCHTALSEAGCR